MTAKGWTVMRNFKRWLLASLVLGVVASESPAAGVDLGLGLLKRRQTKPDPQSRSKQLIETLRNDPDEAKRKAAAQEIRGLDARNVPDIIPALIQSLQKDPSPTVRMEAVDTLGKLKPISQPAGLAMESALQTDPDLKVRDAIKAALWQYHLNGYKTPQGGSPLAMQNTEPGTVTGTTTSAKPSTGRIDTTFQPIKNSVGKIAPPTLSVEPAIAVKPNLKPVPMVKPAETPKPMPTVKPPETVTIPQPIIPTVTVPPPITDLPLPTIPEVPLPPINPGKF
jgi:hypothetical protein